MGLPAQIVVDPTAAPAGAAGEQAQLIVDPQRRLWVAFDSGIVLPVDIEDLQRIAGVVPAMSVGGNLGVNINAQDVPVLVDGAGRVFVDVDRISGIDPLMSAPGRLGVNLAVGDVSLVLGGAGQLVVQLQSVGGNNAQIDANGNQWIRDAAPTAMAPSSGGVSRSFSGGAAVISHTVVGAAGKYLMRAWGTAAAVAFAQLFDKASGPSAGEAPIVPARVASANVGQSFEWDFTKTGGLLITNGVTVGSSSTPGTFTATVANIFVEVEYA